MKAIVCTQYGPPDVLQFEDIAKPTPAENEVSIKLHAASVNPVDLHLMRGKPFFLRLMSGGLRAPKRKVPGHDIAGRVEAAGSKITQFKPGDEVFGACRGAFAEYACALEDNLALKPANVSFEDAAAIPIAALTALQGLRDKGHIQPGRKVLIDGASGGVGTFAVQIAKSFGAEVTAVCSTQKMDTARSIGADHVIDYTRADFTKSGQRYDLILAANAHHPIFDYRRALSPNGIYVMAGGGGLQALQVALLGPLLSRIGRKKICFFLAKIGKKDLVVLKDLMEARKVRSVIDRRYPLSATAEALRYLAEGHAQGKIVITVEHSNDTVTSTTRFLPHPLSHRRVPHPCGLCKGGSFFRTLSLTLRPQRLFTLSLEGCAILQLRPNFPSRFFAEPKSEMPERNLPNPIMRELVPRSRLPLPASRGSADLRLTFLALPLMSILLN